MTNAAGGNNSWNVDGNWSLGHVPVGFESAVIDSNIAARINAVPPDYSGNLTLREGASFSGWTHPTAIRDAMPNSPARLILHDGTLVNFRMQNGQAVTFDNIDLMGTATIRGGQSTSGHHGSRNFDGPVRGGEFILDGVNNNTFNLNTANSFNRFSTGDPQNQGFRVNANANGSLGTGDVEINSNASLDIPAGLTNTIADIAVLSVNGPKDSRRDGKIVLRSDETVAEFRVDGARRVSGTWGSSASAADNIDDVVFDPAQSGILTVGGGLEVSKTVSAPITGPGSNLTYTITVLNLYTGALGGVVVTDSLPFEVGFVASVPPPDQILGNQLIYDIGNLASNSNFVITVDVAVTATPPASLTITNVATGFTTNTNILPQVAMDEAETQIFIPTDVLQLNKSVSIAQTNLNYTLTVTNVGFVNAANVTV
ncbi:MAG: hypothetical protein AAF492_25775, partial [Verrucomicrobiota bacterium]